MLEAVIGVAGAIKPQVAFFERFGSSGYRVLERLISDARDADVLVVADAKRGDFANTNEGYAEAWLADDSPLSRRRRDGESLSRCRTRLSPLFDAARRSSGRGVFVLAATSNRRGRDDSDERAPTDSERVEDMVLRSRDRNEPTRRRTRHGRRRDRRDARRTATSIWRRLGGPYLVPGVGAQGAGAARRGAAVREAARKAPCL